MTLYVNVFDIIFHWHFVSGEITVQPGEYSYNFSYHLQVELPTSLEGATGHIRYKVIIVLDGLTGREAEYEEIFTVIKPLNLNSSPAFGVLAINITFKLLQTDKILMPIIRFQLPGFKEICEAFFPFYTCFLCPEDPLHVVARVPVTGYTSGQTINIEVEVNNKSWIDVNFSVKLMRVRFLFLQL